MSNVYISFKEAQEKGEIKSGTKILSYPNRKGVALEGIILGVSGDEIAVNYTGHGRVTIRPNGQLMRTTETNFDIALVQIA